LSADEIDGLKEKVVEAFDSLKMTTSYEEAAKDADLIIEAIAEDPAQKIPFYEELAKYMPEKTVLVTNSSTLLPSAFAEYTGRPEKYLALHFANNIWAQNTAEVMGHPGTDQKYYDQVAEFAKAIGMVPICLKKEQPAYVLNTLLVPFLGAGLELWAKDVADPETIDMTWELATGAPNGPMKIIDVVGLTTVYNIEMMKPEAQEPGTLSNKIVTALKEKIDKGELGINAGKGFYEY
jgi:3-hydroxybutyryl-CoA dehydrogenase